MSIVWYIIAAVAVMAMYVFFCWAVCSEAERKLGRELTILECA